MIADAKSLLPLPEVVPRLRQAGLRVLLVGERHEGGYVLGLLQAGVSGYVKRGAAREIVDAAVEVASGGTFLSPTVQVALLSADQLQARQARLSEREREVLSRVAEGKSNAAIGEALHMGESTVKTYLRRAHTKLGTRRRAEAAWRARELGLIGA